MGVRKMYNMIFAKFYWRSMYVDIGVHVRGCETCSEGPCSEGPAESREPFKSLDINAGPIVPPVDRVYSVWKKVFVQIYGPFNKTVNDNEYVISICDPFSNYLVAQPSPESGLLHKCSKFIFDSFCTFGFAQCHVLGLTPEEFEEVHRKYREKFDVAQDLLRTLIPFDSEKAQKTFLFCWAQDEGCRLVGDTLDAFCRNNANSWDDELSTFLFRHAIKASSDGSATPFAALFARSPTAYVSDDEKVVLEAEKVVLEVPASRRRLRSSTLECRHCHETFTSKISFRIHQRKHTEEARKRGALEGEERLARVTPTEKKSVLRHRWRRRKPFGRGPQRLLTMASADWSDDNSVNLPNGIRQHLTQSTVEAVKNLLIATKEERSKRGKYFKYTPELRDEIAQYALDHSIPTATTYWTERLGKTVSESSIRNFIKSYRCFTNEKKDEIGKYAYHHGIEKAMQHFSENLGFDIRKRIIWKFKKRYTKRFCGDNTINTNMAMNISDIKRSSLLGTRQKRSFSYQMKEEIGRYAHIHGLLPAMKHYSEKLQFEVKESTVRKFKRQYLNHVNESESHQNGDENVTANDQSIIISHQGAPQPPMELLQSPVTVLSGANVSTSGVNVSAQNNFVYQHPYSLNMSVGGGVQNTAAVIPMNHNSLSFHQGSVINQGLASQSYQQTPNGPTAVIMNQPFPQVPPFHQGYVAGFSQTGNNGSSGQNPPLSITHTSATPSMTHANSPLQLTMGGGTHLSQLNSVSAAAAGGHHLSTPHLQSSQTTANAPLQLVSSTFHPNINGNLSFENGASINLNNEPLSLMKESLNHNDVGNNQANLQQNTAAVTSSTGVGAASIIHIPGVDLSQMNSHNEHQSQQHHQHHNQPHSESQEQPVGEHEISSFIEADDDDDDDDMLRGIGGGDDDDEDDFDDPPTPPRRKKIKSKYFKTTYTCGKRGNYVSYSPEMRAEIGRFASENGNLAAITHFKDKLEVEIPESTVRGLKDKYLIKMMRGDKNIKCLGFAQRGRPMRLGKYDTLVQDCIKEIMKDGEKVSSFLVIATAKQVLMQHEPSLLEENGGQVKLNPTWAKSFLKRIGINNSG